MNVLNMYINKALLFDLVMQYVPVMRKLNIVAYSNITPFGCILNLLLMPWIPDGVGMKWRPQWVQLTVPIQRVGTYSILITCLHELRVPIQTVGTNSILIICLNELRLPIQTIGTYSILITCLNELIVPIQTVSTYSVALVLYHTVPGERIIEGSPVGSSA